MTVNKLGTNNLIKFRTQRMRYGGGGGEGLEGERGERGERKD